MDADVSADHEWQPGKRNDPPPLHGADVGKGKGSDDESGDVPSDEISGNAKNEDKNGICYVERAVRGVAFGDDP